MRLSPANLDKLPQDVARFSYDRTRQKVGIVHFGIGAFHRAHQAWYTDLCMEDGEPDWAISAVSMRSARVADQLGPQTGLYSLTERHGIASNARIIGSVREVFFVPEDRRAIVARMAAPQCKIVSFTVTEKGYCRASDATLDMELARKGFYRPLAKGLNARRKAGLPGVTLANCDNLADNGVLLKQLFLGYCAARNSGLADWVERECAFPSSMVDRIVPATTPADLDRIAARLGMRDEGAVQTERFSQWVLEDNFANGRPGWEKHGVQFVEEVAPYETAKLRMLNGAHSLLAYVGLDRGYEYVHEAIADPGIRVLVDRLMRDEAAASFRPAEGQDLSAYAGILTRRFADPALNHRLIQIAMDGSEKVPQRWLATLADRQRKGESCPVILQGLAAWLRHVRGDMRKVDDPMAGRLAGLWRSEGSSGIARALFSENGLFSSHWKAGDNDLEAIARTLREVT